MLHHLQMSTNTITYTQYAFTFAVLICGVGFAVWWEYYGFITTPMQLPPVEKNYPRKYMCVCVCACMCMRSYCYTMDVHTTWFLK